MSAPVITRLNAALEGRYALERERGAGGMATVYVAEDLKHDRRVAIKVLKPELAAVIGAERFLAEIKTTANLQHPHILPLFDSGETDGFLYYVMPYVEGETLRERIDREKQLGVDEAVRIARDVADALDYAHRRGVIHRDMKPANVLLHDGRPMVADFGIALAISAAGGGRMTETGLSLGTPHYMSPEQASADRDLSPRSDVYSLGCVLYEMLAGQPPHTGPSAQSVLVRILTESPRPLTELRHTVPAHVAAVVNKAIEKLPADRFDSARSFMEALEDPTFAYVSAPRAPAPPTVPSAAGTESGWLGDPRSRAALAVTALLAAWGAWSALGKDELPSTPVFRAEIEASEMELMASAERIEISPPGDALAFSGTLAGEGPGIWVRRADEPDFRMIPGTEGGGVPSFSPDGRELVFVTSDGELRRIALDGGAGARVAPAMDPPPGPPHWGDDGMVVFSQAGGLYEVPAVGGDPTLLLQTPGLALTSHRLPAGRGVLVGSLAPFIRVYEPGSDSLRTLLSGARDPVYLGSGRLAFWREGSLWVAPFDLERMEMAGPGRPVLDDVRLVTSRPSYAVARNGTLVYAMGGNFEQRGVRRDHHLITLDLSTGAVDSLPLAPRAFLQPAFSPDGNEVAFTVHYEGSQVYVYDLLGGGVRQLTFEERFAHTPVWSPDGTRLAYARSSNRMIPADAEVLVVEAAGGAEGAEAEPLLDGPGGRILSHWAPGDVLLYDDFSDAAGDVRLRRLDDPSGDVPFLEAEWQEGSARLSPDGRWIAYVSDESGAPQVFVRRFPDRTDQHQVSESLEGARRLRWSPDGGTIFYESEAGNIVGARIRLEPTFAVTERAVVFETETRISGFDVHPSGAKLVIAEATALTEEDQPDRWFVVTNWFEELRARRGEVDER